MKFALGFLVCCVLVIGGTVLFAPEYAHEIIDRIHGNVAPTIKPQVGESNDENSSDEKSKDKVTVAVSEPVVRTTVRRRNNVNTGPVSTQLVTRVLTAQDVLDQLRSEGYRINEEDGGYRVTWRMFNLTASKPTGIFLMTDGTLVPRYRKTVVSNVNFSVSGGVAIINGYTITTSRGMVNYLPSNEGIYIDLGSGDVILNKDGMATTAAIKYDYGNGSWGIETTRSFRWVPDRDSLGNVLAKAKRLKDK